MSDDNRLPDVSFYDIGTYVPGQKKEESVAENHIQIGVHVNARGEEFNVLGMVFNRINDQYLVLYIANHGRNAGQYVADEPAIFLSELQRLGFKFRGPKNGNGDKGKKLKSRKKA